jgi:heme-degrading monooxygenase HmoA
VIAVIFEAIPSPGQRESYLAKAAQLKAELAEQEGFISIERFESLAQPGKILSLSFWRDEAAVAAWRALPAHRDAQSAGRKEVFADYRIRIASVVRDYGLNDRGEAPQDSLAYHGGSGPAS